MKCIITHKYSCFFLTGNVSETAILIQLLNIIQNDYSSANKLTHTIVVIKINRFQFTNVQYKGGIQCFLWGIF